MALDNISIVKKGHHKGPEAGGLAMASFKIKLGSGILNPVAQSHFASLACTTAGLSAG